MVIDHRNKLVFIATTKSASTSIEEKLRMLPYCTWFTNKPGPKHTNHKIFKLIQKPLKLDGFKTWTVIRHPSSKFLSWFNYRSRDAIKGRKRYLGNLSIAEYIKNASKSDLNQCDDRGMIIDKDGNYPHVVFKYEDINEIENFLSSIYGIKKLEKINISYRKEMPSEDELTDIEKMLSNQIIWFNSVKADTVKTAIIKLGFQTHDKSASKQS